MTRQHEGLETPTDHFADVLSGPETGIVVDITQEAPGPKMKAL